MHKCIRSTMFATCAAAANTRRNITRNKKHQTKKSVSRRVRTHTGESRMRNTIPYQRCCLPFSPTSSSTAHTRIDAAIASARRDENDKNEIRICYLKIHFSVGIRNVNVHLVCARAPSNSPEREKISCTYHS